MDTVPKLVLEIRTPLHVHYMFVVCSDKFTRNNCWIFALGIHVSRFMLTVIFKKSFTHWPHIKAVLTVRRSIAYPNCNIYRFCSLLIFLYLSVFDFSVIPHKIDLKLMFSPLLRNSVDALLASTESKLIFLCHILLIKKDISISSSLPGKNLTIFFLESYR